MDAVDMAASVLSGPDNQFPLKYCVACKKTLAPMTKQHQSANAAYTAQAFLVVSFT